MEPLHELRTSVVADFHQFHLLDDSPDAFMDGSGLWDQAAVDAGMGVAGRLLAIGTLEADDIDVLVQCFAGTPAVPADAVHVVEGDLECPSGRVVIVGCTEPMSLASRVEVPPGRVRVRAILLAEHHARHVVQIWPSVEPAPRSVVRDGLGGTVRTVGVPAPASAALSRRFPDVVPIEAPTEVWVPDRWLREHLLSLWTPVGEVAGVTCRVVESDRTAGAAIVSLFDEAADGYDDLAAALDEIASGEPGNWSAYGAAGSTLAVVSAHGLDAVDDDLLRSALRGELPAAMDSLDGFRVTSRTTPLPMCRWRFAVGRSTTVLESWPVGISTLLAAKPGATLTDGRSSGMRVRRGMHAFAHVAHVAVDDRRSWWVMPAGEVPPDGPLIEHADASFDDATAPPPAVPLSRRETGEGVDRVSVVWSDGHRFVRVSVVAEASVEAGSIPRFPDLDERGFDDTVIVLTVVDDVVLTVITTTSARELVDSTIRALAQGSPLERCCALPCLGTFDERDFQNAAHATFGVPCGDDSETTLSLSWWPHVPPLVVLSSRGSTAWSEIRGPEGVRYRTSGNEVVVHHGTGALTVHAPGLTDEDVDLVLAHVERVRLQRH